MRMEIDTGAAESRVRRSLQKDNETPTSASTHLVKDFEQVNVTMRGITEVTGKGHVYTGEWLTPHQIGTVSSIHQRACT